jgi:hypothetical protein
VAAPSKPSKPSKSAKSKQTETYGRKQLSKRKAKKTSIGASRNSRKTNKRAVRQRAR